MAKTILLTGCSSGIGLAAAARFATEGWNVAATARNPAVLGELAGRHPNLLPLRLDVTNEESIRDSIAAEIPRRRWVAAVYSSAALLPNGFWRGLNAMGVTKEP
ncbi:MAG: SDR family NAD(P)-dependent oxidoreductase [Acidobacteriaceae bacterium]|nr:SDR family NAD(P)-dependent oxidoreductase [Acidobacteriaceae bacterium]